MERNAAVIDIGTYTTKSGFSGDSEPSSYVYSVVGRRRTSPSDIYIGAEAFKKSSILSIKSPIDRRIIRNVSELEPLLNHIYVNELKTTSSKQPTVLIINDFTTEQEKASIAEVMFETENVPGLYPALSSSLALNSAGLTSGIVVDVGEGGTSIVPILEGVSLSRWGKKLDIGGKTVTEAVRRTLAMSGRTSSTIDFAREVKNELCEAKPKSGELGEEKVYAASDGTEVRLGDCRWESSESLIEALKKEISEVAEGLEDDIKDKLTANVTLSGGTTSMPGFPERIAEELSLFRGLKVIAPSTRKTANWIGGSIISAIGTFKDLAITRAEYDEEGPTIIELKSY